MVVKIWDDPIRQLTGYETMHGKLATLPDIRLVYHESGRWKSLAGYQEDKSCEETGKEDHHNTKTAFTGYYKRMADSPHREKDRWCSETGSSEEHEWISNCTHNESQEVLQTKIGCSTADGALRNFSELGLVYHESGRRELSAEYQRDGNASRR